MYIEFVNVNKSFNHIKVLDDINLGINKGSIMLIVGRNGAGKTTLIRLLLGIYILEKGQIEVEGISVNNKKYNHVKERIGFLNDNLGLFRDLTAWDNIEFFHRIYQPQASKQQRVEDIGKVLKRVELYDNRDRKIDFFSRGMKQRLAIARAIVNNPDILVLDEPHRGLDVEGKEMIKDIVMEYSKNGATVLINSHDLNDMQEIVSHVAFMNKGKIVCSGTYADLSVDSNNRYRLVVEEADSVLKLLKNLRYTTNIEFSNDIITFDLNESTDEFRQWLFHNNIKFTEFTKVNVVGLTDLYKKYIQ